MMKEKVLFVIFLLSAASIDGENLILTKAICLASLFLLYLLEKLENCKKKGPDKAGPEGSFYSGYIIAQGKEMVNGKMQSLRRKLRQRRTDRRCLPGMFRRRTAEAKASRCSRTDNE